MNSLKSISQKLLKQNSVIINNTEKIDNIFRKNRDLKRSFLNCIKDIFIAKDIIDVSINFADVLKIKRNKREYSLEIGKEFVLNDDIACKIIIASTNLENIIDVIFKDKGFIRRFILVNAIETPDGTTIASMNRHDYVTHKDKNGHEYSVDGGTDYLKRATTQGAPPYKDVSVYSDVEFKKRRQIMRWGNRGKNGDQPLKYIPIAEMSNEHINNVLLIGSTSELYIENFEEEIEYRKKNKITINDK